MLQHIKLKPFEGSHTMPTRNCNIQRCHPFYCGVKEQDKYRSISQNRGVKLC